MRYIVNESNYITAVAFGCELACQGYECVEYTGSVPTGYTSLEDWYAGEGEQLHRWKVVDGELTQDSTAVAPVDKTIFDLVYPVGSIYLSTSAASPADLFGGTWEQIKDVFLLAAGDTYEAGITGGAATVTLTRTQLPTSAWQSVTGSGGVETSTSGAAGVGYGMYTNSTTWGQPHENMPPYLAVYAWRRLEDVTVTDDGDGHLTILGATLSATDDGKCNVTITGTGLSATDDGDCNITIK